MPAWTTAPKPLLSGDRDSKDLNFMSIMAKFTLGLRLLVVEPDGQLHTFREAVNKIMLLALNKVYTAAS